LDETPELIIRRRAWKRRLAGAASPAEGIIGLALNCLHRTKEKGGKNT
jgi:hypothetical protein